MVEWDTNLARQLVPHLHGPERERTKTRTRIGKTKNFSNCNRHQSTTNFTDSWLWAATVFHLVSCQHEANISNFIQNLEPRGVESLSFQNCCKRFFSWYDSKRWFETRFNLLCLGEEVLFQRVSSLLILERGKRTHCPNVFQHRSAWYSQPDLNT